MTARNRENEPEVRNLLERAAPKTRYHVEEGLKRHRALVEAGAALPEWAKPSLARFGKAAVWVLSALGALVLGGVMLSRSTHLPGPLAEGSPLEMGARLPPQAGDSSAALTSSVVVSGRTPSHAVDDSGSKRSSRASLPEPKPLAPRKRARVVEKSSLAESQVSARSAALAKAGVAPGVAPAKLPDESDASEEGAPLTAHAPGGMAEQLARSQPPQVIDPEVLAEMQQVAQAEKLLAAQPARTLALVREGMQRFRPGYLAEERRYLEIMALLGLGRPDDARLLSRAFLREYPRGPYRRKVGQALEAARHASED